MNYSIIIILIFILSCSPAQKGINNKSLNSLSKYSYPIFAIERNHQHTGTAFFYLSNDTTFLVSNYHAIKGVDPLHKKIEFHTDTLWLKYQLQNSANYKVIPIDISESKTGKTEIFSMIDRIDLFKVAIEKPSDGVINYINELIDTSYFKNNSDSVFLFGYPSPAGSIPLFYSSQRKLSGTYSRNGFTEYDSALMSKFPNLPKGDREILNGAARFYYFIKPIGEGGFSGSPVLGRFKNKRNTVYKFIGVIFASEPHSGQSWVIRGDIAYEYFKSQF